ncbi:Uncharacterised protein [[Pasteurella] mairii]|uniref:Uncharacterized protein n=1 Tax=[Pasteurella] mairii TaxID=757 RepID=A0A379B8Z5_9PAST|nr:Uncharacterised protein [[Pasteurella] mairii]
MLVLYSQSRIKNQKHEFSLVLLFLPAKSAVKFLQILRSGRHGALLQFYKKNHRA